VNTIPAATTRVKHLIDAPNFRCLPDRVSGIPIRLEIRAFGAEIPVNRFHENPQGS
jgi:hypothetical protein